MDRLAGSGRNRSVASSVPSLIGTAVLRSVHSLRCADKRDICKAAGFGIAEHRSESQPRVGEARDVRLGGERSLDRAC
jgi:hypothetical protein